MSPWLRMKQVAKYRLFVPIEEVNTCQVHLRIFSVSYLRVFGCLAYAHIPQQLRGKLDDKAVKCIFVGYSSGSKGYRLYNPATNKIFESRDVIFAKTTAQPMVVFDVPHMQTQEVFEGFLPSFVENQESQQVDNFDQSFDQHVTPHDVEEIVREEQEVLNEERTLPKWVQKTLQDSKLDASLPRKTRADEDINSNYFRPWKCQLLHNDYCCTVSFPALSWTNYPLRARSFIAKSRSFIKQEGYDPVAAEGT
ncbi:hypothetical protein L7F22_015503 [Adiantum nelumboides]|nr:hypothetical protein [Adiantum nelumboides]